MRIMALVRSLDHVCCRYRIAAFRSALQAEGHTLDIRAKPDFWLSRLTFAYHLKNVDALIVQRRLLPAWQLRQFRERVRWLLFDYDDAVYLRNPSGLHGTACRARSGRFDDMVRSADAVVAGNPLLRGRAGDVTDEAKAVTIPTCIDAARYPLARHEGMGGALRLAWIGSSSTICSLQQLSPVLNHLGKEIAGLELKVICDRSIELENLQTTFAPWSEATEARDLAGADVGISWLPDDPWSWGKCGLKVLQYMAAGLPVVANPVGVQADLVRHGENGFLVETPEEWVEAVRTLARDPGLRLSMGRAGRRRVENEYDVSVGAALWVDVLRALEASTVPQAS